MIFWKEWRSLRLRFGVLAAFYGITALMIPIDIMRDFIVFSEIYVYFISWGAALLFIPAIMGMDAYVGERDQETEDFLLSKPLSTARLLAAKIGLRLILTLILTGALFALTMIRVGSPENPLYLFTPPYLIWYVTLSIITSQLVVLMVTVAVSVRAPYQSTSLIIGGSLGAAIAAFPLLSSSWQLSMLQAPWGSFWLLVLLLLLTAALASTLLVRREVGRSVA